MLHTEYLRAELLPENIRKDLVTRATGRFYTPASIGKKLAVDLVRSLAPKAKHEISIIDPFCGDGRLIAAVLMELAATGHRGEVCVEGWDIDEAALVNARRNLVRVAANLAYPISISMRRRDTLAHNALRQFDVVITNPPWDVLKPEPREMSSLTPSQRMAYINRLRDQSNMLKARFPHSQSTAFSRRSQNLARVGIEASMRLKKELGVCGIVFPATLLADQASAPLREWLFKQFHVASIDYYAAELKLFSDVDQSSVGVVFSSQRSEATPLTLAVATRSGGYATSELHHTDIADSGYRIPFTSGVHGIKIQRGLRTLQTFKSLEADMIWAGRELDETNHASYLTHAGKVSFVKGRMVSRYELEPSQSFISRQGPQIPKSSNHWRVAWRDVSRQTQRRRMQATLVPPQSVTGNSLNVAYVRDGNRQNLHWLLGVMNSLVFEFQVRSLSATSHISLGTARLVKMPPLSCKLRENISELAEQRLSGKVSAEMNLEVTVAKSYGLSRGDFELVVNSYTRLEEPFKMALLSAW